MFAGRRKVGPKGEVIETTTGPVDMQQALHEGILESLRVLRDAHVQYRGNYPLPQNPDYEAMQRADAVLAGNGAVVPITAEMVREALAHVPVALKPVDRWEWVAGFLNRARAHPDVPCPCCNVTPAGDILDHLPDPPEQFR